MRNVKIIINESLFDILYDIVSERAAEEIRCLHRGEVARKAWLDKCEEIRTCLIKGTYTTEGQQ